MNKRLAQRRGYAMMLVMIFVVLFAALLGVAWRRVASTLRVEHSAEVRKQCDQGSLQVMAKAMQTLETRLRWDGSQNKAGIDGNYDSPLSFYDTLNDTGYYKVVFTRESEDGSSWSVSVTVVRPEDIIGLTPLPGSS